MTLYAFQKEIRRFWEMGFSLPENQTLKFLIYDHPLVNLSVVAN